MSTYTHYREHPRYATNQRFWRRVTTLMVIGMPEWAACEIARTQRWRCDCGNQPDGAIVKTPLAQSFLICAQCAKETGLEFREFGKPPEPKPNAEILHRQSLHQQLREEIDALMQALLAVGGRCDQLTARVASLEGVRVNGKRINV